MSQAASALALAHSREITPRQLELMLSDETPREWSVNAFATYFMNALSITFPPGERFFMASVKALLDHVDDPVLLAQVRGFLAQEALHGREHSVFNDWLHRREGVDVPGYTRGVERMLRITAKLQGKLGRLGATCALEHFTAILAEAWLTSPNFVTGTHKDVRPLAMWHALEELDHKSVAFDVYTAAGGSYFLRVVTMVLATLGLFSHVASIQLRLMARDGMLFNFRMWRDGMRTFWGKGGLLRRVVPAYLRYFLPSFHPWDTDDRPLIEHFTAVYLESVQPDAQAASANRKRPLLRVV